MKLKRTKQCKTCPWKVDADPYDIPNGYCEQKHKNLEKTIAKDLSFGKTLNVMECHYSIGDEEEYCVGWLVNQLGVGNNIGLRLLMRGCENAKDIEVFGEQHEIFEETLPENK